MVHDLYLLIVHFSGGYVPLILFHVVGIFLGLLVTGHVLLRKRDIDASIGWIAVTWFMPVIGSLLYIMLGINRVRRRAQKLVEEHDLSDDRIFPPVSNRVFPIHFSLLSNAIGKLTKRPLVDGNKVSCLRNGDRAYPEMIKAIQRAEHYIFLASYIFRDDGVGCQFVDALGQAHARGVEVRVLVDGVGCGYLYSPILKRLRKKNIRVARFMHSFWPWKMPFLNLRNHKKILIVDGRIGFIGGLNIGDENHLTVVSHFPVSDMHFKVEGPVIEQLIDVFVWDWSFTTGEELSDKPLFPAASFIGTAITRVVVSGPDNDMEKIEFTMMQAISLAQHSIYLMTPYFLPRPSFLTGLAMAALRGVEVDIVMPERSNHCLIDWARDANNSILLEAGCRLWLSKPPFNHAKLMVVDKAWSFIGSANLDVRSLRLNFEVNMEVYEEELAAALSDFIYCHCHRRVLLHDLSDRRLLVRLRDATARLFLPYL